MLFSSPAGNDLLFDEKLCEQGRNFANKIWNAFRLIKGWEVTDIATPPENRHATAWFESRFGQALQELNDQFTRFRMSEALLSVYKLIWDDFCSWYLEMIKPEYGKPIDQETHAKTTALFDELMALLHPFMPFITEELWHALRDRSETEFLARSTWPSPKPVNTQLLAESATAFEVITQVRNTRNSKGLSPKERLTLEVRDGKGQFPAFAGIIEKLANVTLEPAGDGSRQGVTFLAGTLECAIPLEGKVDASAARAEILKELEYHRGFLAAVDKKLSNERFVGSAPAQVVDLERKKKADAESKIRMLEENLSRLTS
jgi:valyl-tRNA synthetase